MKAEKKARTNRVINAATAATETVTEKLPELSDADAEIQQATERHNIAERETAAVLARNDKATGHTETESTEGVKPNGQDKVAEPAKPHLLTEEAHKLRKQLVNDPRRRRYAADTMVQNYFLAKGYSPEGKRVTKADLIAYMQEMETSPSATSGRMFSDEAFQKIVKHLRNEVKSELFKRFDKQTGVGITDDLMRAVAEATVAVDKDLNLEIDGDFETCFIESCDQRRFVPLRGVNAVKKGNQTEFKSFGNFLYVEPNEENGLTTPEIRPHCVRCSRASRFDAKKNGQWVVFLPKAEAQRRVDGWLANERRREERSFSVGAAVRSKESRDQRRPDNRQYSSVSDDRKRAASQSVNDLLGRVPGDYFFKHSSWEIRGAGGYVGGKGAKVFIQSDGTEAVVLDREKDFGKLIGERFPLSDIPKKLFVFLQEVRNLSRTD